MPPLAMDTSYRTRTRARGIGSLSSSSYLDKFTNINGLRLKVSGVFTSSNVGLEPDQAPETAGKPSLILLDYRYSVNMRPPHWKDEHSLSVWCNMPTSINLQIEVHPGCTPRHRKSHDAMLRSAPISN